MNPERITIVINRKWERTEIQNGFSSQLYFCTTMQVFYGLAVKAF